MAIKQPVSENALRTKEDLMAAFRQLTAPLTQLYSTGGARLEIRGAGAGHTQEIADMEGFSRISWGLVPYLAGGGEETELKEIYLRGLINGTDPGHEEYWGEVGDYDQRLVEMAAMGLALCLAPETVWYPLDAGQRRNLYNWLNQINVHPCHDCNWLFFQIMVNLGFRQIGEPYDAPQMERNLQRIDEFYLGNGWYSDGIGGHSDYYGPFAIHFYSLVYVKLMENEDPQRCSIYKERALLFAEDFAGWFDADGSALPYGRSLSYRFAQSAFWSAFAYAGLSSEALTPGVVKGMILRNLRWWFSQPIFDSAGVLTVGYAYPNLVMAENYNAPGSPYWAFKTFLVLALETNSGFWMSAEEDMPQLPALSVQAEPHLVVCRDLDSGHVAAFNSGHLGTNAHTHTPAKYEKFVYSTRFGFSVPRAEWGLEQASADSMLALSERDQLFRVRRVNEETWISGNVLYAKWRPWGDVEVQTWIVAGLPWHVRIHKIKTGRPLTAAEGGYSLAAKQEQQIEKAGNPGLSVQNTFGESGVCSLRGYTKAQLVYSNVNTNVLYPRTSLPSLLAELEPGSHLLISAVCGAPAGSRSAPPLEEALVSLGITRTAQGVTISREGLTDITVEM
ncbi:hypothetical protein R70723_12220 [Paenibacillus sp. FSL R7-0273]|uniref:DUF2264 domain-containing protein n=1 Tax=Paenibacillus sp. FSL R7-0273 TaxID=1536772 RepID=UPI0004F60041|nr:DUF2264 domain-containing protein [Paenibacillus sp. FSL R7-0273]AIQ46550.1 hypothetical protein R70723_12220 [Paenibacillus sp. FSL R7-0273]OMF97682.1 hypothetical protein BK144_03350 [Paenibacillus sp. FSL R7-0273]